LKDSLFQRGNRLAAQFDEALAAIRSVSIRRTNRKAKAKKAALDA